MIAQLRGTLRAKSPTRVVVDCQGTGYDVGVPLSTSNRLAGVGEAVELLVVTRFTQTGVELYGFLDEDERDVFRLLLSVKGIGPKAGLNFLSRLSPAEIRSTIARGDIEVVQTVPGIGPKRAARVLAELAEKTAPPAEGRPLLQDAVVALQSLGLTHKEARSRLDRLTVGEGMTLQEVLRQALRVRP